MLLRKFNSKGKKPHNISPYYSWVFSKKTTYMDVLQHFLEIPEMNLIK